MIYFRQHRWHFRYHKTRWGLPDFTFVGFVLLNHQFSVQWFVDLCVSLCPFSFVHCVVCPSIYGFWLSLWYLHKLFLYIVILDILEKYFHPLWIQWNYQQMMPQWTPGYRNKTLFALCWAQHLRTKNVRLLCGKNIFYERYQINSEF